MWFAPESPWWLVRHGKLAEAERSVRMLSSKEAVGRAPEQVANMVRVTKLEQEEAQATGNSSWMELFKGTDLRRTEITCLAWIGWFALPYTCVRVWNKFTKFANQFKTLAALSLPDRRPMFSNKRDFRSLGHSTWVSELLRSTSLLTSLICKPNSGYLRLRLKTPGQIDL